MHSNRQFWHGIIMLSIAFSRKKRQPSPNREAPFDTLFPHIFRRFLPFPFRDVSPKNPLFLLILRRFNAKETPFALTSVSIKSLNINFSRRFLRIF